MKKDTIITSIVTIILNLIWSTVFDLLPNIVDFSIFGEIQVSKYLIFIPILILFNVGVILIFRVLLKRSWERETFISQFETAISKLIEEDAANIPDRQPHMAPGPHQSILHYYNNVVNQLKISNGRIEFQLEDYPKTEFNVNQPVFLSNITPGMFKYFMIVTQDYEKSEPEYLRIRPDFKANPEEFTFTWFDKIFPILGNLSDKISVKEMPLMNLPESSGYFEIRDFKIVKKKNKYYFRINVI